MWAPVIERLSDAYTCISVDLPGHGESPEAKTYNLEAVAGSIHELVERLELARPIMVGHSICGIIVAIYAGTYPTVGLVTSDQKLRNTAFLEQLQRMRGQLQGPAFPEVWRAIESGLRIDLIPDQHRHLVEESSNPRQEIVLGYWHEALEVPPTELQERLLERVHRIQVPFTAIFGKDVEPDYRAWLSGSVPQCNVIVFPNAGHFPHLVDPDRFANEVRALADKAFDVESSHRADACTGTGLRAETTHGGF